MLLRYNNLLRKSLKSFFILLLIVLKISKIWLDNENPIYLFE